MRNGKRNHASSLLAGFLLGKIVGAVIALLLTSQKGERSRLQLAKSIGLR
jgi:gas vesicle protein